MPVRQSYPQRNQVFCGNVEKILERKFVISFESMNNPMPMRRVYFLYFRHGRSVLLGDTSESRRRNIL